MENGDNHVSYYKTTVTSTNYTFFYEDTSQNKNEKSKNYEWKNEKNCNGKRSRKKNYQAAPGYYNQNKKREIYKKEKNQFTDNEKSNYYPVRDNKQKKINFKNIKNNIFFDNNNNNENCEVSNNLAKINNSEINKHHHYSRNKNNVNNFSKINRNIAAFIKNEQRAYYDSNGNINSLSSPTNSDDNFRLTKELLEDLDKRNKDMDEENDGSCDNNNNNTNDFLIYVKKKIEEKKENVTKRRKNNWGNNEHYQENNFDNNINDNYISPDKKDNDCNNIDNSYKYTKEASSESGNYNEYIHNVDTYKTINNDNISVFSDESTRVFINKKNKVSINMCDNPCDMWYGLKDRNGKNVFIDSVKNRDHKKQKKKKKISSKTKKYYISKKKGKYDKWGDNYYGIANSDASSISGNTIATMHIDGNNKYNKKNIFSNPKNNIPYNSNGTAYNNENNNNPPNFKIFYNKNNLNNTQNDKMQKKNIPNHNYHQLAKNDIKNKNNIPWSGKNNIINNNSYNNGNNYGHKNQFELSKNIKNNYYDNKTINTSIRIKLPDNKISAFAENSNPCTSDTMPKSLEHINNGVSGDLNSQNINNTHIGDNKFKDNCINSNDNNNDDSINEYYYHRGENKRNMLSDYMNSALSSAVGYNAPNRNPPIENNHINGSENKFQNGINNVHQNTNYENSEKNIFNNNNNNIPTYEKNNNMNYNLELHHLKLNNISNYSEANIVEYPAQNNQPNNALLHTTIDGVGINNRAYYSQTNNKMNEYNGEGITISRNNETYGIGNLTNYNDNNANNLHSNMFSNNCKDNSKEAYMSYSSIVTKSLPHINDMNNNYARQANQDYTNNTNYYNISGNNNQGQEGIANKIEDNNINKNDLQNNNVNITNPNNTNDHLFADQNQSYKNNYYNNTKFDLSYEMDDDMRRRKKKKKWNVSFDYKSTFKSARERVQSLLASRRGVKY
ncbi:hypothetical protein YYG_04344 [Plasmodium vinckei petteri]|uniref:Uncharacterized protein n=1 Tax=Plasmodium vinckei petteri TaxID=138298 RepID=W7AF60_PLAVN|nr:hypothetical protein YYG_04344 [Plasmodium vinckei petteri]CAD2111967.1 conserved Plasmodium protein, unknown function [Plasmodium vinckei petteri]